MKQNSATDEVKKRIFVIIPFYNETEILEVSWNKLRQELESLDFSYRLIFVDDGSTDNSVEIVESLAQVDNRISLIVLSRNFGKENAIFAGLEHASEADAVVVMDCDLQHPPELISTMFDLWKTGKYDIIEGVKRTRGKESWFYSLAARLFYWLMEKLAGTRLKGATDFKLLDRIVLNSILQLEERNVFFRGLSSWVGFRRIGIDFDVPERIGSFSKWNFNKLFKLSISGITNFSSAPLQFTTFLGGIFLVFSFFFSIYTVYLKISKQAISGFATIIILQLFIGSVILITQGIIGIYIANLFTEVKKRPNFIVRSKTGFENKDETK